MARLTDPQILQCFQEVLSNWRYTGYVEWKVEPRRWLRANIPALSEKDVAQIMCEFMVAGGEIDQVPENRPEWNIYDCHYDFRLDLCGRRVYIETVLDVYRDDPTLVVVSIHDA